MKNIFLFFKLFLISAFVGAIGYSCVDDGFDVTDVDSDVVIFQDSIVLPLGSTEKIPLPNIEIPGDAAVSEIVPLGLDDPLSEQIFWSDDTRLTLSCEVENATPYDLNMSITGLDGENNKVEGLNLVVLPSNSDGSKDIPGKTGVEGKSTFTRFDIVISGEAEIMQKLRKIDFSGSYESLGINVGDSDYIRIGLTLKLEGGIKI